MIITDAYTIDNSNNSRWIVNVTTGTLVATVTIDGEPFSYDITEPSFLTVPGGATISFALNGDTASIKRG